MTAGKERPANSNTSAVQRPKKVVGNTTGNPRADSMWIEGGKATGAAIAGNHASHNNASRL